MILDVWKSLPEEAAFPNYDSGTWGPSEADALLTREGREWWNGGLSESAGVGGSRRGER
ncbi:hypothetical protein FBQ96_06530, partial [Nitrospirales bacterium NOB]|nr:hypothetical protein [Nitrospirales bacterium NOB]